MTLATAGWTILDVEPCPDCELPTTAGRCPQCGAYVFTVPPASKMLTANRSGANRYAKADLVKEWQTCTRWALKAFTIPQFTARAEIITTWHGKGATRRDGANSYPTVKAIVDAMVKSGVLVDDDHAHLYGPIMLVGRPRKTPTVTVAIRPYKRREWTP